MTCGYGKKILSHKFVSVIFFMDKLRRQHLTFGKRLTIITSSTNCSDRLRWYFKWTIKIYFKIVSLTKVSFPKSIFSVQIKWIVDMNITLYGCLSSNEINFSSCLYLKYILFIFIWNSEWTVELYVEIFICCFTDYLLHQLRNIPAINRKKGSDIDVQLTSNW